MKLTMERVRALLAAATPGPWEMDDDAIVGNDGLALVVDIIDCESDADADLIAAAHDLAADLLDAHAALATERERCARLCDAAAARWALLAPGDTVMTDDRRARHNEAAALAAEIRGGDIVGCP